MLIIPLSPVPSQVLLTAPASQRLRLAIYAKTGDRYRPDVPRLYMDLAADGKPVLAAVPCLRGVRIVRDAYLGVNGDLAFFDGEGADDPQWAGLGGRWFLAWLPA